VIDLLLRAFVSPQVFGLVKICLRIGVNDKLTMTEGARQIFARIQAEVNTSDMAEPPSVTDHTSQCFD
jgi:hypothetical protein